MVVWLRGIIVVVVVIDETELYQTKTRSQTQQNVVDMVTPSTFTKRSLSHG